MEAFCPKCHKCNGVGKLKKQIEWEDKFFLIECPKCNGTGKVPVSPSPQIAEPMSRR
jgi:DnaJ-class molecular chaperone